MAKRKNEVESELGIEDNHILHVQPDDPNLPPEWRYRVRNDCVKGQKVVINKIFKPNPVSFDWSGVSEYIPKDTYEHLLKCGYVSYMTEEK